MGMKRHPEHHVEFYEWAPGAIHFIFPVFSSRNQPHIVFYLPLVQQQSVAFLIEIFCLGARFCSVVGDFNNWEHRKQFAGEGYMGRDDFGYYRVRIDDELREGEESDIITQV